MEDLARTEADEQPALGRHAAARGAQPSATPADIPLRQRDAEELRTLEKTLPATDSSAPTTVRSALLVAELTT